MSDDKHRTYALPATIQVTLCPYDRKPIPRSTACWSTCGDECWVEAGALRPVTPERSRT